MFAEQRRVLISIILPYTCLVLFSILKATVLSPSAANFVINHAKLPIIIYLCGQLATSSVMIREDRCMLVVTAIVLSIRYALDFHLLE